MSSPDPLANEKLAQALRQAEARTRVFIPPAIDQSILKQAHDHFQSGTSKAPASWSARARRRFSILQTLHWRWILASAFAAIALCLVLLPDKKQTPPLAREDINGDGRVDILDALALTRAMQSNSNNPRFDQNGDRELDDLDVRAVAMAAVRLDQKPGI